MILKTITFSDRLLLEMLLIILADEGKIHSIKPKRPRKIPLDLIYFPVVAIRSQLELTKWPKHTDRSLLFERGLSVEEVAKKSRERWTEWTHKCRVKNLKRYLCLCKRLNDVGRETNPGVTFDSVV